MKTLGPKVAAFFEKYLVHPKGDQAGTPFVVEPWQRAFLNELYRINEQTGERVYRQAILGIPRGNGKTPLAAGIGLFELMARKDAPEIYNLAGAIDQAGELTKFATAFVDRGVNGTKGRLQRHLMATTRTVSHKSTFGVMKLLSSAGSLQHGKSVSAFIADELHAFETDDQQEAYAAMWTALHKRVNALGLIISTAGFNKATLLGQMYDEAIDRLEIEEHRHVEGVGPCLRIGRDEENGVLFWWYGPPDELTVDEAVELPEVWRAVNPGSWILIERLKKQLGGLGADELDFARLHLNMWTQSRDVFIPALAWKACRSPLEPQRKVPVHVAVDVGLTSDTTAVSWSQRAVDEHGRARVVDRVRVWSANPAHERDPSFRHQWVRNRVDLEDVLEFVFGLHRAYGIAELVADPTFFEGELQKAAKHGIRAAPIGQAGINPRIAAQQFYLNVKRTRTAHANDPVLNRHIAAAAAQKTEGGWRISKLKSSEVIDACVATSYSDWRGSRASSSVYDGNRGLLLLGDDDGQDAAVDDDDDD